MNPKIRWIQRHEFDGMWIAPHTDSKIYIFVFAMFEGPIRSPGGLVVSDIVRTKVKLTRHVRFVFGWIAARWPEFTTTGFKVHEEASKDTSRAGGSVTREFVINKVE